MRPLPAIGVDFGAAGTSRMARSLAPRPAMAALALALALVLTAVVPAGRSAAAESLSGQLLVAMPGMADPRFVESVVFMVEHDAGGAMGLIVNRPVVDIALTDLLDELEQDDDGVVGTIRMHYGGPVEPDQGFVLHSSDVLAEGSVVVDDAYALTVRPDMLRRMASGDGPRHSRFMMGYAGWGPGQLEAELSHLVWFTIPAELSLVFADDPAGVWERAMARRGIDL